MVNAVKVLLVSIKWVVATAVLVFSAATVPLAGCSSTAGTREVISVAPSPSQVLSSSSERAMPVSLGALRAITVQRSEVPQGYQVVPYQAGSKDTGSQAALVRCVGGTDTSADRTGAAHSPEYVLKNLHISSQAESFGSQKDLDADVALLRSPRASKCYEKSFTAQLTSSLPSGSKVKEVTMKVTPHSAGEPSNVIGTGVGSITVEISGKTVKVNLASEFMTGPLIESEVDFLNADAPIPVTLLSTLVKKVAARTAAP